MSVQTHIDRISGAVSAALAALAEKGVEVPAGTKVDGLAALIAAIEAGGGGGGGSQNATFGTITAISSGAQRIEHGLGAVPGALVFMLCGMPSDVLKIYDEAPIAHIIASKSAVSARYFLYRGSLTTGQLSAGGTAGLFGTGTSNTNYDRVNNINDVYFTTPYSCDGGTYLWVAFKEALV